MSLWSAIAPFTRIKRHPRDEPAPATAPEDWPTAPMPQARIHMPPPPAIETFDAQELLAELAECDDWASEVTEVGHIAPPMLPDELEPAGSGEIEPTEAYVPFDGDADTATLLVDDDDEAPTEPIRVVVP